MDECLKLLPAETSEFQKMKELIALSMQVQGGINHRKTTNVWFVRSLKGGIGRSINSKEVACWVLKG